MTAQLTLACSIGKLTFVNSSRLRMGRISLRLRLNSAKSCRHDYLDRFRKPDGEKAGKCVGTWPPEGAKSIHFRPSVSSQPLLESERASETVFVPLERWTIAVGEGCPLHAYMPTEDIHAPLTILRVTIILESIFEPVYKESNRVVLVKASVNSWPCNSNREKWQLFHTFQYWDVNNSKLSKCK